MTGVFCFHSMIMDCYLKRIALLSYFLKQRQLCFSIDSRGDVMNWQIILGSLIFVVMFVFDAFVFKIDLVLYLVISAFVIYLILSGQKYRD